MKFRIITLLFLFSVSSGYAQDKKVLRFADDYLDVAFWQRIQGNYEPLVKWPKNTQSLKYKIVGEFEYINTKAWDIFISDIKMLTDISLVETDQEDYNILIYFGPIDQYLKFIGTPLPLNSTNPYNNWGNRRWDEDHQLISASFGLDPSKMRDAKEGLHRLNKGMIRALGLLGELDDEYSIFHKYPTKSNTRISRSDKRLIKLHYHDSVECGTESKELRQTILGIPNIEELAKEKL